MSIRGSGLTWRENTKGVNAADCTIRMLFRNTPAKRPYVGMPASRELWLGRTLDLFAWQACLLPYPGKAIIARHVVI